jgi:lipoate-protein ligase A
MHFFNLTLPAPAEYLAADEALLDWCEAGHADEMLLFWEPPETFVVVGYANKVATEVNAAACQSRGVPIFRRCSGGGTVVQMPGGLNYSLILRITETGPTRNISSANQFIMEKNRAAVQSALGHTGSEVSVRGHTDLALITPGPRRSLAKAGHSALRTPKKIAGNAQRRRKHFLLFHGTLLLNCDLNLISELLQMPTHQPDYRASRSHNEFVTNLNLPAKAVKDAFAREWNAGEKFENLPADEIQKLAREKYEKHDWNYKF